MPLLNRQGTNTAIPADVAERAATRWVEDEKGCWISTYSTTPQGYAQIGWERPEGRGMVGAHRAAWTHHHGQIPTGLTVDHSCHERRCVNVAHLALLENSENARRNYPEYDPLACPKGHLREGNTKTRLEADGTASRSCRECDREATRRSRKIQDAR